MHSRFDPRLHLLAGFVLAVLACGRGAAAGPLVDNVNTDRAAYTPGSGVTLYVDLVNGTGATFDGSVEVAITHLGAPVAALPAQAVTALANAAMTTKFFSWTPPAVDFKGYLVVVQVKDPSGVVVDSSSCAIDVSSDWTRFPRYGYLARYDADPAAAYHVVWQLKNFHINALQFYDWQWKHHLPYNAGSSWPDIANRTIQQQTVNTMISAAHDYGMLAFNYNLYGGAYDDYASDGSGADASMGIYDAWGNQLSVSLPPGWATSRIYEMNNRDPGWQSYIFWRESQVFAHFPFDGWHIDCLGQHEARDYAGNAFNLDDFNAAFINNAKAILGRRMMFNTVDAVGESQVAAGADVDVLYSELWDGNAHYSDFANRVESVRALTSKAVVFAAYPNRGRSSGTFNEAGVRLADAAIFACGASHLELGDGDKMLHTEYFPDDENVVMTPSLATAMHAYYDFLVGYENLLRDSVTTADLRVSIAGVDTSTAGAAGAVWVIPRKNPGHQIVHLINLLANPSSLWRDNDATYPVPPTQSNLSVRLYYEGVLGECTLRYATPDRDCGAAITLAYTKGVDANGSHLAFTLPELRYWDMIWIDTCEPVGAVGERPVPGALEFAAPWPNPAAHVTNLAFTLAWGDVVRVEVFDVAGHRVRSLIEGGWLAEGEHRLAWDHRDAGGHPVAPGIYQVRVSTGATTAVRRVVVAN